MTVSASAQRQEREAFTSHIQEDNRSAATEVGWRSIWRERALIPHPENTAAETAAMRPSHHSLLCLPTSPVSTPVAGNHERERSESSLSSLNLILSVQSHGKAKQGWRLGARAFVAQVYEGHSDCEQGQADHLPRAELPLKV